MALDQVFGHEHRRGTQLSVALSDQRTVGVIDLLNSLSSTNKSAKPGIV
jgi:hypothetical protein